MIPVAYDRLCRCFRWLELKVDVQRVWVAIYMGSSIIRIRVPQQVAGREEAISGILTALSGIPNRVTLPIPYI